MSEKAILRKSLQVHMKYIMIRCSIAEGPLDTMLWHSADIYVTRNSNKRGGPSLRLLVVAATLAGRENFYNQKTVSNLAIVLASL
jgi:hypothetical protein